MSIATFTKADEYRRQLSNEMSAAMRALHVAERAFEGLKEEAKEAKASVEVAQARVNRIADELRDVELGQYQPALLNVKAEDSPAAPSAESHPIDALIEHGLTEKQVEKLRESELEIDTVEKLEQVIAADEWWMTKAKGIGPTTIDKISDAIVEFRKKKPLCFVDPSGKEFTTEEMIEDAKAKLAEDDE